MSKGKIITIGKGAGRKADDTRVLKEGAHLVSDITPRTVEFPEFHQEWMGLMNKQSTKSFGLQRASTDPTDMAVGNVEFSDEVFEGWMNGLGDQFDPAEVRRLGELHNTGNGMDTFPTLWGEVSDQGNFVVSGNNGTESLAVLSELQGIADADLKTFNFPIRIRFDNQLFRNGEPVRLPHTIVFPNGQEVPFPKLPDYPDLVPENKAAGRFTDEQVEGVEDAFAEAFSEERIIARRGNVTEARFGSKSAGREIDELDSLMQQATDELGATRAQRNLLRDEIALRRTLGKRFKTRKQWEAFEFKLRREQENISLEGLDTGETFASMQRIIEDGKRDPASVLGAVDNLMAEFDALDDAAIKIGDEFAQLSSARQDVVNRALGREQILPKEGE